MLKKILVLTITILLPFSFAGWAKETKAKDIVSVNRGLDGYTLSINANNIMLEEIVKELIEKCDIRVVIYEKDIVSRPVSVSFNDLSIEQGIKRLIKAAGIKNHLLRYRNDGENKSVVAELSLLGSDGKGSAITFTKESMKTENEKDKEKEVTSYVKDHATSQDEFSEKIASFKERYVWEAEETQELAGHLFEVMPDPAKGTGLEELVKGLDSRIKEGEKDMVDEEMLYQAIEGTVPPNIAPMMMKHIKEYVQGYKSGVESEVPEKSANELYQEYFSSDQSRIQ